MGDFLSWLAASSTTTALFVLVLWLARNLILTRLKDSVQHEFDTKLEELRADLRKSEEQLKADLRAKEAEIASLRSGVLTALTSRQIATDKRRLEAVDQLWSAVVALAPTRVVCQMMSAVNFETAAKHAPANPELRQFFDILDSGFGIDNLDLSGASKARPFVSPMAWATYSALVAISTQAIVRFKVLKTGADPAILADEPIANLVKAALPHQADYIDKFGAAGYHLLLEELEERLLQEVQTMLEGKQADKASLDQAAEVLRLAHLVQSEPPASSR